MGNGIGLQGDYHMHVIWHLFLNKVSNYPQYLVVSGVKAVEFQDLFAVVKDMV